MRVSTGDVITSAASEQMRWQHLRGLGQVLFALISFGDTAIFITSAGCRSALIYREDNLTVMYPGGKGYVT